MDLQYFLTAVDFTGSAFGSSGAAPVIPAAPTLLSATADADSIALAWTENGTYDTVAIDRKTTGEYTALATINGGIATYDDTTAVVGTEYTYKVRGVRNGFPSPYSNEDSDTIPLSSVVRSADFPDAKTLVLSSGNGSLSPGTGNWSMTCWVRPTFLATASNPRGIFSKGSTSSAAAMEFGIAANASFDRAAVFVSNGIIITEKDTVNSSLTNNDWNFIAVTYNSGTLILSISINDGTPVTQAACPALQSLGNATSVKIGGSFGTGIDPFIGQICMLGIWQKTLTSGQITTLYNAGVGVAAASVDTTNLLAYYNLDQDSDGSNAVARTPGAGSATDVDFEDDDHVASSTEVPS